MSALSKYKLLEMSIPITTKLLIRLHLLIFNNMAVVETKANTSCVELVHGLIAI